ncbi:MAG TPA: hypothetical protein VNS81_10925 [Nocardioides sp.]|nr:hypothetical protein [Nocardioides sp.]
MTDARWVRGVQHDLLIPADLPTLLEGGPASLTAAFRAAGVLAEDNAVNEVLAAEEFEAGGTGKKAILRVAYAAPAPGLPEELFIKFSRNFDNELWDRARFLMLSEVSVAQLASAPGFPVPVPAVMFADVEPESATGLIVTERIPFGRDGIEPHHPKCLDHEIADPVEHYAAILRGLARLSGAHRAGRLPEADKRFPFDRKRAEPWFGRAIDLETLTRRAVRMFDFVERHPQLFPPNVRDPGLREQFLRDLPDVIAARDAITSRLLDNPDFVAFAHWNANIDNCWFDRGPDGVLRAGFLDWANAGQLSVAQSICGAISGAEPRVWDEHLDHLLALYIVEYAAHGGPRLDLTELRLHVLLVVATGVGHATGAAAALPREIDDLDAVTDARDPVFLAHENARIQLHMTTQMLNVWQTRHLGEIVRSLGT